jgi:ELWxxDGT repeat protein
MIFWADDGTTGSEPWRTDGTVAGTYRLGDIYPGRNWSSPSEFTYVDGVFYFSANDGTYGKELWRSDGTVAGTYRVTDINPGRPDGNPGWMIGNAGQLYFAATDDVHGTEPWVCGLEVPSADAGTGGGACPSQVPPAMVRVGANGAYCIDSTEVTNADYQAFLQAKGTSTAGQPAGCANTTFHPSTAARVSLLRRGAVRVRGALRPPPPAQCCSAKGSVTRGILVGAAPPLAGRGEADSGGATGSERAGLVSLAAGAGAANVDLSSEEPASEAPIAVPLGAEPVLLVSPGGSELFREPAVSKPPIVAAAATTKTAAVASAGRDTCLWLPVGEGDETEIAEVVTDPTPCPCPRAAASAVTWLVALSKRMAWSRLQARANHSSNAGPSATPRSDGGVIGSRQSSRTSGRNESLAQ